MKRLVFIIACISLVGCKKPPSPAATIPTYTLSGYAYVPSSGIITNAGQISVDVQTSNPAVYLHLADGVADNTGYFKISYTQTYMTYPAYIGAQVVLSSQYFTIDGIPVNKSEDRNYEESSSGLLALSLNPTKQLGAHDTLFVQYGIYPQMAKAEVDTFLSTYNGYYKTIRQPKNPGGVINWGIGKHDLNSLKNRIVYFPIEGDPVIDSLTINY